MLRSGNITLLSLLSVCCLVSDARSQSPTNTIPLNQPSLVRTFPPTTAEQTTSGTGKFVIFTREQTDKTNDWDFIAGAWECIPSRPGVPITKRVEFGHSSWSAQPLLDCLVRDDSEGLYPQFVTLQVDSGDRNFAVNLYDINYRTWDVRGIWQGNRLDAFGYLKNFVFCQNSQDRFCINVSSGNIVRQMPFIPLDVDGAFWLVRKVGENAGAWSFDAARGLFVGHFGEVEKLRADHTESLLSKDGKSRAWLLVFMPEDWRGGVIDGSLVLQRNGQTNDIRVPVKMQARMGSGLPVIPMGTHLNFTQDGAVEFSARQHMEQIDGPEEWVWRIDIVSGNATTRERPYVAPKADDLALFDGVPTPEYLRPHLKDFWHFGRGGLAPALLMHLGILKRPPEFPECWAGVSRDGRHVLFKAKEGSLADVFIYGDLQTKQTVRWACPAGMLRADSLEFVWVVTP